ncbi:MAG: DMT family transporter [Chloroflexi bacterium]|nr:DMT family transporter [Chloroflexota bacterium]
MGAALAWGADAVVARVALQRLNVREGTLISLITSILFVVALTLVFDFKNLLSISPWSIFWFALVGVFTFPMGRFFNYLSISRIGVSRATPIISIAPFFSMVMAVIFLQENLTPPIFIGTASILTGLFLIITGRKAQ